MSHPRFADLLAPTTTQAVQFTPAMAGALLAAVQVALNRGWCPEPLVEAKHALIQAFDEDQA